MSSETISTISTIISDCFQFKVKFDKLIQVGIVLDHWEKLGNRYMAQKGWKEKSRLLQGNAKFIKRQHKIFCEEMLFCAVLQVAANLI